jgi:glycosyltransferase involved in cell wall biosynthesis
MFLLAGEQLGGAEWNAIDLASHLSQEGADVSITAFDDRPGRARSLAEAAGIPWRSMPVVWGGSATAKTRLLATFAWRARRLRPDVLVASTNLPNVIGGLSWHATGARSFVWTQCDVLGTARFSDGVFRRALRSSPAIVTTAMHARTWLAQTYDVDDRRIHVVYSRVELGQRSMRGSEWRVLHNVGRDAFAVGMIANLHAGKDHPTLLRAWRLVVDALRRDGKEAVLLLAGRPATTAAELTAIAHDLDLGGHVRFLGDVANVADMLDACDAAAFSSYSECLGRGATEPMSRGLPVVGSDVPGIREAVGEPGRDLLVPPGDHLAMAASILRLARDPGLRSSIGQASEELIRVRQSRAETNDRFARLLESLARGLTPPDPILPSALVPIGASVGKRLDGPAEVAVA